MNRQPRALLSVLLFAVIAFVGWRWWTGTQPDSGGDTAISVGTVSTRGGRIVSSIRSEPRTFNRLISANFAVDLYSHMTGGKLLKVNRATQALEPGLAESWTVSPDNLTFTLKLREGVMWSDGTPFTADDVLFTFEAIYDPSAQGNLGSGLMIDGKKLTVTAPDPRTIVIKLPSTFGPGIALLDNLHLVPKHKLQTALANGTFGKSLGTDTPPGDLAVLGPFKLRSYEPGQRLVFERNERYWKKDAAGLQLPYLDQVVFEVVPDQNAEFIRLQAGQLDMLQQQVRPEDIANLRPLVDQGKLRLIELGVGVDPDLFFFNLNSSYWAKDPRRDWIMRKEFRQAISHAIDREAYANTVLLGAGVPIWGPVTSGNKEWFSPNVQRYGFSVERAKELLAGLGLTNRDADEWLEDPKGTEARFSVITYRGNSSLERGLAVMRDMLKPVGINVDVVTLEAGALGERLVKNQFDSIMFFVSATNMDPSMSLDFWMSSGSAHFWNRNQEKPATDWEKEVDDLMLKMTATADQAERKNAFDQVQKIFADQLPVIYLVAPRMYMAVTPRVSGVNPALLRPQLLWDVEHLSVSGPPAR